MSHILVVEDEEHLAKGIKFNLEAEGYFVTAVDNGKSALEHFRAGDHNIDLVILDLMLPGMSGYAVCEELRALGSGIPILILSARTLTEDRTRGFDAGADQYLTKPFELDELLARVKGLLARHVARITSPEKIATNDDAESDEKIAVGTDLLRGSRFQIGQSTVDFQTYEVTKGSRVQRMTPLEIRLLQYLIRSAGKIVSRQQLLEDVWEQPGYLQTRAPDQFIRRLRKIFEAIPSKPKHFITVRDAGYCFVAKPEDE